MIKLFINGKEASFELTQFPDKSSQVWRINHPLFEVFNYKAGNPPIVNIQLPRIVWKFENEAELAHVLQLGHLVTLTYKTKPILDIPFLVYGRQDKEVSNDKTFALHTLVTVLKSSGFFEFIRTIDAHNLKLVENYGITNIDPSPKIQEYLGFLDATQICFPDKGAGERGYKYDYDKYGAPIILDKKRNQETGAIEGLKFASKLLQDDILLRGHKVLIIDDICDGGRTFIEAAKLLKEAGASKVYLYTTHGIYSKGVKVLFDSGIDRVLNYDGEVGLSK